MKNNTALGTIGWVIVIIIIIGALLFWLGHGSTPYPGSVTTSTTTTTGTGVPTGNIYSSTQFSFDVMVPSGFTTNESYVNQELGPDRNILGVSFIIPASTAAGTNLSSDSHVAVEEVNNPTACVPADFINTTKTGTAVHLGGNSFMVASSSDAGAGNLYDETAYVTEKGSRCYAVVYYIHSGQFGNYPAGSITMFDRAALTQTFDTITSSLELH